MNGYSFRTALGGLWRDRWINFLSVLTIATALIIISVAMLAVFNIRLAVEQMPERFFVTVFLSDGAGAEDVGRVVDEIRTLGSVRNVRYISPEDALADLKEGLRNPDFVLDGLEENPLPASLEIKLDGTDVDEASVRRLADVVKGITGVEDVFYPVFMLEALESINFYAQAGGATALGLLGLAVLFVIYATVKILLHRKQIEIETLKLLGATKWFIRAPVLIEGGTLGLLGGVLALVALVGLHGAVAFRLAEAYPLLASLSVPVAFLAALPPVGLVAGLTGAMLAVGRLQF
jgi:cell division transport system permease protein